MIRNEFYNYQNLLVGCLSLSRTLQKHRLTYFLYDFNTSQFRVNNCEKSQKNICTDKYATSKNMNILSKKLL